MTLTTLYIEKHILQNWKGTYQTIHDAKFVGYMHDKFLTYSSI